MRFHILAAMLCISWLMPLHFLPWVSWHAEAVAFGALFALAVSTLWGQIKKSTNSKIVVPAASVILVFLALLGAVQSFSGLITFVGDALVWGLYMLLCLTAMALGYAAINEVRLVEPSIERMGQWNCVEVLALILLVGAFASTILAFVQVLDVLSDASWIARMADLRRPGGNTAQPNHLATLLVMAMASLVYLRRQDRIGIVTVALLWLVFAAGLAATESRAGLLGFVVLLLWWIWKRTVLSPWTSVWWGVTGGGIVVLMFTAWPSVFETIYLYGEGEVQGRLVEGSLRWAVWPQLVEAVLMRPWLGWGVGNVAEAHNAVAHAYAVSEPYTYSHNLVLDLALWFGIPAALVLVGVTAVWLWRRLRAANDAVSWYALAVALPVGVHAMFEFPHAYAYFLVPVMLALGVLESRLGGRPLCRIGIRPAAGLLLVVTGLAAWSAVEYLRIEEDFRVARFEALRIGQRPTDHERPKVLLLTQLGALVDSTRIQLRPGMPQGELTLLKQMALRHPWTATQYRYAVALALNGQGQEAARQMAVLRAQHGERIHRQLREQLLLRLDEHGVARGSLP